MSSPTGPTSQMDLDILAGIQLTWEEAKEIIPSPTRLLDALEGISASSRAIRGHLLYDEGATLGSVIPEITRISTLLQFVMSGVRLAFLKKITEGSKETESNGPSNGADSPSSDQTVCEGESPQ